ncbi:MAG TPA: FtsX-like permease family protein, partial [Longimicrobiales bacterium]|nr:FtsX-like permease family protein [Longimicrobiales bacterium]
EGLVLALAGGALGTLLAVVGLPGLLALLPADVPRRGEIALDGAVLAFTLAVSLGACLLFTAAPVVLARRTAPARVLAGRDGDGGGRGGHRLRAGLVVVEVALGLVLAAGTTAVVRSVGAMAAVEPGFRTTGLATVRASFPEAGEMSEAAKVEQWRRVVEEVAALPGIDAAGAGIASPTALGPRAGLNVVRPDVAEIEADRDVVWHPATPGYLPALGVRLLRGRGLSVDDRADAPPVAVVSDRLARTFFPEEEVLGRTVTIGLDEGHAVEIRIVGVVEDTRNRGPTLEPVPVLYRPLAQAGDFGGSAMTVAAHGAADPALRLDDLEDAVRRAAPTAVVYGGAVGASLGEGYYGRHRFVLRLLGAFAVLAVALAAVGIYGVTAHGIRRRRREIGIRMALGASRRRVLGSVFRGGLGLALVGVALGGALTVAGGRLLEAFLFRAAPAEPTTLAGVSLALLLVAALALALPGRQAVRVHPAEAIRRE